MSVSAGLQVPPEQGPPLSAFPIDLNTTPKKVKQKTQLLMNTKDNHMGSRKSNEGSASEKLFPGNFLFQTRRSRLDTDHPDVLI